MSPTISDGLRSARQQTRGIQTVELLLPRHDRQVDAVERGEKSPLWLAAWSGHIKVAQQLLRCRTIGVTYGWGIHLPQLLVPIGEG
jgi:hypothetical protein